MWSSFFLVPIFSNNDINKVLLFTIFKLSYFSIKTILESISVEEYTCTVECDKLLLHVYCLQPLPFFSRKWYVYVSRPVWPGYTVGWLTSKFISWYPLKLIIDTSKNVRWTSPFKKFSRTRVNAHWFLMFFGFCFFYSLSFFCLGSTSIFYIFGAS